MIGALAGIILASKSRSMRRAYGQLPLSHAEGALDSTFTLDDLEPVTEKSKVNIKTVKKILAWWAVTVPTAFCVSVAIFKITGYVTLLVQK